LTRVAAGEDRLAAKTKSLKGVRGIAIGLDKLHQQVLLHEGGAWGMQFEFCTWEQAEALRQ
jgi:hypothetical protein